MMLDAKLRVAGSNPAGDATLLFHRNMIQSTNEVTKMIINKIYVNSIGDPDAGIFPAYVTIDMDGTLDTGVFAEEDVQEVLEEYREQIRECFSNIFDDNVCVIYDFEIGAGE